MPNIAITNYCNLKCSYCFAERFKTECCTQNITSEQLATILEFILNSSQPVKQIGIIGGEPTLHPEFKEILYQCREAILKKFCGCNKPRILIFTNGINLSKYIGLLDESVQALINVNEPSIIGEENWKALIKTLIKAECYNKRQSVSLGINLYQGMQDFKYIFELTSLLNSGVVRCSYVCPSNIECVDKELYYSSAKKLYLDFLKTAQANNVKVSLDCNHIPNCYFTEEELKFQKDVLLHPGDTFCNPVIDILPDLTATSCFGNYSPVNITQFENLEELERYFLFNDVYPKTVGNIYGRCKECAKAANFSCQGGCLSFSHEKQSNTES